MRVEAEYVYVMQFEGDKIRHMTKIWNDGISLPRCQGSCRLDPRPASSSLPGGAARSLPLAG
jgi:hypothetical protein